MTEQQLLKFWQSLNPDEQKILLRQYFQEMSKKGREAKIKRYGSEGFKTMMKSMAIKSAKKRKSIIK